MKEIVSSFNQTSTEVWAWLLRRRGRPDQLSSPLKGWRWWEAGQGQRKRGEEGGGERWKVLWEAPPSRRGGGDYLPDWEQGNRSQGQFLTFRHKMLSFWWLSCMLFCAKVSSWNSNTWNFLFLVAKFYVLGLRTCFQSKGDQGCFSVSKDSEGRDVVLSPVSIIPKGIITFFITMNTKDDTINDHLGKKIIQ